MSEQAVSLPSTASAPMSKEQSIIEAATRLFLRHGYGGSSMDAIAQEAGVSKQTIYHHFGSKDALFGAIITQRCDGFIASLISGEAVAKGIEAVLTILARQFLELALSPSSLALHRVMVAEVSRFPELGRAAYQAGAARAVAQLAAYLEEETRRGHLMVEDPRLAAEQFFGTLMGHIHLRALLGIEENPPAEMIERHLHNAIRIFLAAYRPHS